MYSNVERGETTYDLYELKEVHMSYLRQGLARLCEELSGGDPVVRPELYKVQDLIEGSLDSTDGYSVD